MIKYDSKNFRDNWAYDISKNVIKRGEIKDIDVINQSIEMILGTYYGERLFNPYFGSELQAMMFEGMTVENGNRVLSSVIDSIKTWEDRITIIDSDCRLILDRNKNTVILSIPYIIKQNNIKNKFEKKILF